MRQPFRVQDQHRENQLSLVPGGSIVIVEYTDGKILEYDKIKNVQAYLRMVRCKPDVRKAYLKQ